MKLLSGSLLMALALAATSAWCAVVEPPDGKDNPLTEPSEPLPTPTKRPSGEEETGVIPTPAPALTDRLQYNPEPMVRVDVLMVSLPQELALTVLPDLRDPAKIAAAEQKLLQMIGRKEANLIDWPEVTLHSGSRAVCENIIEERYAIEFQQPASSMGEARNQPVTRPKEAASDLTVRGVSGVPTAFETRNTGATLEAEAVVSPNGESVTVQLVPQMVRLERMVPRTTENSKGKLTTEQPMFSTRKISTSLTLNNGERRLLFVGKPVGPGNQLDLFIVGVQVFPLNNGKPPPEAQER